MGDQPPYGQPPYGQPMQPQSAGRSQVGSDLDGHGVAHRSRSELFLLAHPAADFLPHREEQPLREVPRDAVDDSGLGAVVWFIVVVVILPIVIGGVGGVADSATGSTGLIGGGASLLSCGLICVSWVGYLGFLALLHLGHDRWLHWQVHQAANRRQLCRESWLAAQCSPPTRLTTFHFAHLRAG